MKIEAAVLREVNKPLTIEELELAAPKQNEVRVKVAYTGFCHSDLHAMRGEMNYPLPLVCGHETSGIVDEIGPGVTTLKKGDRVVCIWQVPCGTCDECIRGNCVICRTSFLGHASGGLLDCTSRFTDKTGAKINHMALVAGFADHIVVPEAGAIKIRDDMPLDQACLMGCCVPTGIGAVWNRAGAKPEQAIGIWGLGGVGLNVLRGAALSHANPIVAVDCNGEMEGMAKEFGATHFIDNSKEDPVTKIMELTDGVGLDYGFDASGEHGAIVQAWWAIRKGGSLIQVGITNEGEDTPLPLTYMPVHMKSIIGAMYGHFSPQHDIPKLIDMAVAGDLMTDKLIEGKVPLAQINEVREAMINREIKGRILIKFD